MRIASLAGFLGALLALWVGACGGKTEGASGPDGGNGGGSSSGGSSGSTSSGSTSSGSSSGCEGCCGCLCTPGGTCCGLPCYEGTSSGSGSGGSGSSGSGSGTSTGSSSGWACPPGGCGCLCGPLDVYSCNYPCSDVTFVCPSAFPLEGHACQLDGVTCQVTSDAACAPPSCTCENGAWACKALPCGAPFPGEDAGACPAIPGWSTCSPEGTMCVYPGTTCQCIGSGWMCTYSEAGAD
jgi:hypothetical protein